LNEVLAFDRSDPHNPTFSPHLRLPLLEDVLTLCSSLVTVKAAGQDAPKVESLEVRLAHNSVKDYLLSHDIKSGASSQFALEAGLAHSLIAGCCLGYLQQFHSQLDMAMLQQFPLASYAAQFWTEHYRHAVASDRDLLDRLALQLLTTKEVYRNCCCLYNPDRRWQGIALKKDPGVPPLYYASLMGLSRIIILLIANGADPNEDASRCQQKGALGAAAYNGHESIVQDLLNAGANPDGGSEYDEYGSPIGAAASQGHTAIVSLLLRAGANLNKSGVDGAGSALYQAVSYRRPGIVKILVDAGADANANAGMSGVSYAISEAAQQGDVESVCLLFPKVSDWLAAKTLDEIACSGDRELLKILLQTKRGRGMTGIQYAARAGMSDLVQSMVGENWGDANNYPSTTTTTALCQAAASGSLETTQILYENGADKIVSDEELSEAVALAANDGHTLVVKYLLDRGADTGSQKCQDALVDAARNGHLSTVQILLTAGVSANSQYKHEYTIGWLEEKSCLWAAVDQQHLEISRLLLASGADPNTQYNTRYDNISALNRSIKTANKELFDLLIDKGASPTPTQTKHARYDTLALPVHYAASVGNVHILRRLLEAGLKPDEVLIEDGWTALFHAAKAGHEEVLRILIHDYGADIHRCANKGTVAIHTAAYHNHSKCIEVFLDAGLDVDVQGRFGRTSLHWAAQQGSIDAVRILLDRGASVFIEEETKSMKAVDIAKVKALGVLESQKSEYHWKQPREDNYEPILKMLEEKAAQPRHGSNEHGHPFRGRLRSVTGRGDSRQISPP
jgi:ankyrin repeat protein